MLAGYPDVSDELKFFMESFGFELQQSNLDEFGVSYWRYCYVHAPGDTRSIEVKMENFPHCDTTLALGHIMTAIKDEAFHSGRCRQAGEIQKALNYGSSPGHGHPIHQLDM